MLIDAFFTSLLNIVFQKCCKISNIVVKVLLAQSTVLGNRFIAKE